MIITITWDLLETRQADLEVPDDTPPQEITRLAVNRAKEGGGETIAVSLVDKVDWVDDCQPQHFGAHYGSGGA